MESSQSVKYYRLLHRPITSMLLGKKIPLAYRLDVHSGPLTLKIDKHIEERGDESTVLAA